MVSDPNNSSPRGARDEAALHRMTERVFSVAVKGAGFAPRAARAPLTESVAVTATAAAKEKIPDPLLKFAPCYCNPHFQKPRLEKIPLVAHSRRAEIDRRAAPRLGFGHVGEWESRQSKLSTGT